MKVLLDTDVLMDVALGRADFGPDSRALLVWCHQTPQAPLIAWHTVLNLYYLLSAARSATFARSFLEGLLEFAAIVSGGTESVRNALGMRISDFEDALQVAAAVSGEAQFIITRNVRDYRNSLIPALSPRAFLLRFVTE